MGHFPLGDFRLGKFTPSKLDTIAILDSFVFYKTKGKVVKQSYKKLKLLGVPKLIFVTKMPLMVDMRIDPITTTSTCVTFSQASKCNIMNMTKEIEEYELKVEKLE